MSVTYTYDEATYKELTWCMGKLFAPGTSIKRASLQEDFGGVDAQFLVNQRVPVAIRVRRNRPAYAADIDVTFRHTEPRMMAAHTYAPIALFAWIVDAHIVAARCIDVYGMVKHMDPPFAQRPLIENGDGTAFYAVTIPDLWQMGALLKLFDGREWTTGNLGGQMRLNRIVQAYTEQDPKRFTLE